MELDSLIREAVSWLTKQREQYLPSSIPLDDHQKTQLKQFFTAEILNRARIVDLSQTGKTLPYPPFYETVRAGGDRVIPDAAHMTAMPFVDLIAFNQQPTLRTLFHNLVHVTQHVLVGTERVIKGYFKTLNEVGLWMVVPFEEQAYQLDARYTRDPSDVFSVEDEVREWMRAGRY
jgi:hypothetical protein